MQLYPWIAIYPALVSQSLASRFTDCAIGLAEQRSFPGPGAKQGQSAARRRSGRRLPES